MYTFNPAFFVLPDLDSAGSSPLRKFRGNGIFRGHLERGGRVFIGVDNQDDPGQFDVNVVNVVHFHKFIPGAAKPAQLQYILFGKGPGSNIAKPLKVEAIREFYFEESELFMPPKQGPTAEERRSGFPE